jgi:hypothetical protein
MFLSRALKHREPDHLPQLDERLGAKLEYGSHEINGQVVVEQFVAGEPR